MKRICFIVEAFYPESAGVGNSTLTLANAFVRRGWDVSVITRKLREEALPFEDLGGVKIHRIGGYHPRLGRVMQYLYYMMFFVCSLYTLLFRIRPDVALGQTAWTGGVITGLAGVLNPRLISMVHTHGEPRLTNNIHCLARIGFRLNKRLLVTNRDYAREVREWGGVAPIFLAGNILEEKSLEDSTAGLRKQLQMDEGRRHALCIGRLVIERGVETKGFSYAIRAMAESPGWILHVLGDGEDRAFFEKVARDHGVEDKVFFHGAVPRDKVYEFLQASDVFLLTSLSEGVAMVMLEAMMLKKTVIATQTSGPKEYIRDGENGLIIDSASVESIAERLHFVDSSPETLKVLGLAGYQTYLENFTEKPVVEAYLQAIKGENCIEVN